jgi:hypothetical protein
MLLVLNLDHVTNCADHSAHFGCVFDFDNAVHLVKAKALQSCAL